MSRAWQVKQCSTCREFPRAAQRMDRKPGRCHLRRRHSTSLFLLVVPAILLLGLHLECSQPNEGQSRRVPRQVPFRGRSRGLLGQCTQVSSVVQARDRRRWIGSPRWKRRNTRNGRVSRSRRKSTGDAGRWEWRGRTSSACRCGRCRMLKGRRPSIVVGVSTRHLYLPPSSSPFLPSRSSSLLPLPSYVDFATNDATSQTPNDLASALACSCSHPAPNLFLAALSSLSPSLFANENCIFLPSTTRSTAPSSIAALSSSNSSSRTSKMGRFVSRAAEISRRRESASRVDRRGFERGRRAT
jgi:hypothetical protein